MDESNGVLYTEYDGYLLVWLLEGEGGSELGVDDNGAVDCGAVEVAVRVPPERTLFLRQDDPVGEVAAGADGTLGDVLRPVGPRVAWLVHTMPMYICRVRKYKRFTDGYIYAVNGRRPG